MNKLARILMITGVSAVPTISMAQAPPATVPQPGQAPVAQPVQVQPAQPANAQAQPQPANDRPANDVPGPIDSLPDLQDSGRMLFKLADTNNDGQISQKEAIDAGNLMVGGFFFRADADGNGSLTQEEANQARQALFAQQPLLRYVLERGKQQVKAEQGAGTPAADPAKAIGNLLDTNNDKKLEASEVRDAVKTGVQAMFAASDTNRDNQLSPTEINSAIIGAGRAAAQAAFDEADGDRNGSLSRAEFDKAILEPANMVFAILDGDGDGQISSQEAQKAQQIIGSQLRMLVVPEPANSARNLIRTGAKPEQVAPVPALPRR